MFSGGYHKSLVFIDVFQDLYEICNILCFPKLVKVVPIMNSVVNFGYIAIFDNLYLVK